MTTPTKRSAKARKMYLIPGHPFGKLYENAGWTIDTTGKRAFVLPAAPEDVERMREAVAKAIADTSMIKWPDATDTLRDHYRSKATAALTTLGLTPAKKTKAL